MIARKFGISSHTSQKEIKKQKRYCFPLYFWLHYISKLLKLLFLLLALYIAEQFLTSLSSEKSHTSIIGDLSMISLVYKHVFEGVDENSSIRSGKL